MTKPSNTTLGISIHRTAGDVITQIAVRFPSDFIELAPDRQVEELIAFAVRSGAERGIDDNLDAGLCIRLAELIANGALKPQDQVVVDLALSDDS